MQWPRLSTSTGLVLGPVLLIGVVGSFGCQRAAEAPADEPESRSADDTPAEGPGDKPRDLTPAERLYQLDDTMMADYADTQREIGYAASPVIIAEFNREGGKYTLRRNGKEVSVEPVPPLYKQMKSVSHTIVAVFEIVSPYFDDPSGGQWRPKLETFNKELTDALSTLDQVGMSKEAEARCHKILEEGVKFTGAALSDGTFSREGYTAYAVAAWPSIAGNVDEAGRLQVDQFEAVVKRWRNEMGEEEWSKMYAIVATAWAMRRQNAHFQILADMMGREAVNDRLLLAESIQPPTMDDLLMLLGRIINDRILAVDVFGDKKKFRMDVELMGEAVRKEIEKRATPQHPALDLKWLPYEEHKMPNE